MDTNSLKVKGSFKKAKLLMEGGEIFKHEIYNKILFDYISYLRDKGDVESSIKQNIHFIVSLITFLETKKKYNLNKIKMNIVHEYITLYDNNNYSNSYRQNNKIIIHNFFNWLYKNNLSSFSGDALLPRIICRTRENIIETYNIDEVVKLLNSIDISTNEGKELYLIMCLISFQGFRVCDIVNLKITDIDFNQKTISIIQHKTKIPLILPLVDEVKYALLDYMKNVRPQVYTTKFVFIESEEPYLQKSSIKAKAYMVKKALINAGIDIGSRSAGYHIFRHSFSTILLNSNTDLKVLSKLLGHLDLDSTMIYVEIDKSKLKELALEVPIC